MSDQATSRDVHLVETKLDSESVFDGRLLHVRRDTVRLPSGRSATREYLRQMWRSCSPCTKISPMSKKKRRPSCSAL